MVKYLCVALQLLLCITLDTFSQKKSLLSPGEFEKQINQTGIQILDVRTTPEYTAGHIEKSLLANWLNQQEFKDRVQYLDKDIPVFVYCGTGVRSHDAAKWLRYEGFKQVFELENGFTGWKSMNKPMEAPEIVPQMSVAHYQSLLVNQGLLLVDFGAAWCPPCKKMEPVLQQLQYDLPSKFQLLKIDAGIHTQVMQAVKVEKFPTFVLYKNGKELWRKEGMVSLEEFKSYIQ